MSAFVDLQAFSVAAEKHFGRYAGPTYVAREALNLWLDRCLVRAPRAPDLSSFGVGRRVSVPSSVRGLRRYALERARDFRPYLDHGRRPEGAALARAYALLAVLLGRLARELDVRAGSSVG